MIFIVISGALSPTAELPAPVVEHAHRLYQVGEFHPNSCYWPTMRLWSLHPKLLDPQGLVALWREGLLAQKVLAGKTRGYKHHPQLERFRAARDPLTAIGSYLSEVAEEADRRGYRFDKSKISKKARRIPNLTVTRGQLKFEFRHLRRKLKLRSPRSAFQLNVKHRVPVHPSFKVVPGEIEPWEVV